METTDPSQVTDLMGTERPQYVTTAGNETVEVRPSAEAVGEDPIQGAAFSGDSRDLIDAVEDASIDLVVTSPPFALQRKKEYGNKSPRNTLNGSSTSRKGSTTPLQRMARS
ncbi:hypothetical protein [Haloplanus rubicundus]|nr:hypothetical protein [Haloplanus rubicundus]